MRWHTHTQLHMLDRGTHHKRCAVGCCPDRSQTLEQLCVHARVCVLCHAVPAISTGNFCLQIPRQRVVGAPRRAGGGLAITTLEPPREMGQKRKHENTDAGGAGTAADSGAGALLGLFSGLEQLLQSPQVGRAPVVSDRCQAERSLMRAGGSDAGGTGRRARRRRQP